MKDHILFFQTRPGDPWQEVSIYGHKLHIEQDTSTGLYHPLVSIPPRPGKYVVKCHGIHYPNHSSLGLKLWLTDRGYQVDES